MRWVTFPIKNGEKGDAVSNLQLALEKLGYQIPAIEKQGQKFGDGTLKQVVQFQRDFGLKPNGEVDESAATALNKLLADSEVVVELKTHGEKLDKLGVIDTKLIKLGSIDTALGQHTNQLNSIDTKLNRLSKLDSVDTKLDKLGKLDSVDIKLDRLAKLESMDNKLDRLGKLDSVDTKLDKLTKLDSVDTKLERLGKLESMDTKLDRLGKLDSIDSKIGQLNVNTKPGISLGLGDRGEEVEKLQTSLIELGFHVPEKDLSSKVFGVGTKYALLTFQSTYKIPRTGVFDNIAKEVLNRILGEMADKKFRVEGRILFDNGMPAKKIRVRLYRLGLAGEQDEQLGELDESLGADGKRLGKDRETDDRGFYLFTYSPSDKASNVQLRVAYKENGAYIEVPISATKFSADRHEVLNLIAPASIKKISDPEHKRLIDDLKKELGGIDKLSGLQENDKRQDLTHLHEATGWDARLIAFASIANRLSLDSETGIALEALYGMFRAGLPTDKNELLRVGVEAVGKALKKTQEAGIISLSEADIKEAQEKFGEFVSRSRRELRVPGAVSKNKEMLSTIGLTDKKIDDLMALCATSPGRTNEFWEKSKNIVGAEKINSLKFQCKMGYLTLNNAALIESIKNEKKIDSLYNLAKLVDADLYESAPWEGLIKRTAENSNKKIEDLIPVAYPGKTTEARLKVYAEDLARKVRLSYPTDVVRRKIDKGELDLGAGVDKTAAVTFLKNAAAFGFELGRVSLGKFIQEHHARVFKDIAKEKQEATEKIIKKLHRLYQITPSDNALKSLLKEGFESAQDIVTFPANKFLSRFGKKFASEHEAHLVYRKAQQVNAVIFNVVTMAKQLAIAPPVYSIFPAPASHPEARRDEAKKNLIKQYPTMASLLGSLDFCECEHCLSVLSPAAYFVDLLEFLNTKDSVSMDFLKDWKDKYNNVPYPFKDKLKAEDFLNTWKDNHGNAPYPFKNLIDWNEFFEDWKVRHPDWAAPDPQMKLKPYDLLVKRRPDLPYLPLTCENTNNELPYIDLVNEILECYVANDNLTKDALKDIGEATIPELLAEPQNIEPKAYEELKKACYPLTLPFDLWVETVRRFCNYFETPLWQILKVLRRTEELFDLPSEPAIENPTNIANATVDIHNADAVKFKVGDVVTYYDADIKTLHNETKSVSSIGKIDSGGAGKRCITLSGVWTTPPISNDLMVLANLRYNWASIFCEHLGISPAEYKLFTDSDPLGKWYELYGYPDVDKATKPTTDPDTGERIDLNSAKTLARRLGVSYKELIDIVQTTFVNPKLANLWVVWKLRLSVSDVVRYLREKGKPGYVAEQQAFENRLKILLQETFSKLTPNDALSKLNELKEDFKQALVLRDRSGLSNFDVVNLEYADPPDPANPYADLLVFLKINLFVRLWKKLNWTIEETDKALQIFLPRKHAPLTKDNLGEALKTTLIYLAHLKAIDEKFKLGKNSRMKLLTLWSNLPAIGKNPLYAQLFLSKGMLKKDPVFEDPLGNYLCYLDTGDNKYKPFTWDPSKLEDAIKGNVALKNHLLALQGALNMTANEIEQILKDKSLSLDSAPLTLENVSMLYRYGLLAKALKLQVSELISLKKLSGIDPFKSLIPDPLTKLDEDNPFSQTLRFVEIVEKIERTGFKIDDLNYLLRHEFDPVGKYRKNTDALLSLMKSLVIEIRRILTEQALPAELVNLTDDLLRQKLALVLPADVTNEFADLLAGTREFESIREEVDPAKKIDPAEFAGEPFIRIRYDAVRNKQRLSYRGLLQDEENKRLKEKVPTSKLLSDLLDEVQQKGQAFFAGQIETIFAILSGTLRYEAFKENVELADKLDPAKFAQEADIHVSYDAEQKRQRLLFRGLLIDERKKQLKDILPSALLSELLDAVQSQGQAFSYEMIRSSLGILGGMLGYEAFKENVELVDKIDPTALAQEIDVQVGYDAEKKRQRLLFRGLLLDERKNKLKEKIPGSIVLSELLDGVQKQAKTFIKNLQPSDGPLHDIMFKTLFEDINGLSDTVERSRARLLQAILPFIQKKLICHVAVQSLASSLKADPSLTEALLSNSSLLTDINQHVNPLLEAFVCAAERGLNVEFFTQNGSKAMTIATADTGIKDNTGKPLKPADTISARLQGYLEVPASGAYRFFACIDKKNAEVEFYLGSQPDPVVRYKAMKDNDEKNEFVELKQSILYEFYLDARNLGNGDVKLLIQGENLPKGSLSEVTLYPQAAVQRFLRAYMLLAKVVQLITGMGLSEREVKYILTNPADFENIDLSKLLTTEKDNPATRPETLFRQFLCMADYARLKHDLSDGTDDLISIFENACRTYPKIAYPEVTDTEKAKTFHFKAIADLTRRDNTAIRAMAEKLGFIITAADEGSSYRVDVQDIAKVEQLWRLWEALQVLEKLGVPIDAIVRWATPVPDFTTARDLRDTFKACFEAESWLRIAQPIFDKLRQRKRDALASYIMHKQCFDRIEQLFEYFLIDPGMEPVVQTSPLRLAISSVQLFIQRCLLNLEKDVAPSAIDSEQWQWIKRYRVWEANRKIFLYPENWLEPEFRDDKTYLFQELESALLQGDVSNDLVEDAFAQYLKKLEEIARLDIVTMYCEEKLPETDNVLHVVGRTYSQPHKYFYRTYVHQMWTPWVPITAEIEGDHVVAVVWRERLHLFWVTFLEKASQDPNDRPKFADENTNVQIMNTISQGSPKNEVEVQLNWSEYFQGQWTIRETSDFSDAITLWSSVIKFKPTSILIRVTKEYNEGEESAVLIHLNLGGEIDADQKVVFRIVSKHSLPKKVEGIEEILTSCIEEVMKVLQDDPQLNGFWNSIINNLKNDYVQAILGRYFNIDWYYRRFKYYLDKSVEEEPRLKGLLRNLYIELASAMESPYSAKQIQATQYSGSTVLEVTVQQIEIDDTGKKKIKEDTKGILEHGGEFALSHFANLPELLSPVTGALAIPFFYQDNQHTFFIKPSTEEVSIEEWRDIVVYVPGKIEEIDADEWWQSVHIQAEEQITKEPHPIDPGTVDPIDPLAQYGIRPRTDWLTNQTTVLKFDECLVGQGGGIKYGRLSGTKTESVSGGVSLKSKLNVITGSGLNKPLLSRIKARSRAELIPGSRS